MLSGAVFATLAGERLRRAVEAIGDGSFTVRRARSIHRRTRRCLCDRHGGTGRELAHRADERFAMCSTFKWALVGAVLARVDRGELGLNQDVAFTESDLLEYAPVTRANVGKGSMPLRELAEAAVTVSDNTAANLLLAKIDGPAGLTRFFRSIGDDVTRLDRNEPALTTNDSGDPRDTTSPRAMVHARCVPFSPRGVLVARERRPLGRLVEGVSNGARSTARWVACRLGGGRDKTGTGMRGAANDVAMVWRKNAPPILIASYLSDGTSPPAPLNAAHAAIGRMVASAMA